MHNHEINRVLVVTREIPPVGGGAGHVAINLARELAGKGVIVDIVTMGYSGLPEFEELERINIYRLDVKRASIDSSYPLEMLRFVLKAAFLVRKLLKKNRYQVVHSHAIIPDAVIPMMSGKSGSFAKVVTTHGSDVPGYNTDKFKLLHKVVLPVWKWVVKNTDVIVSPSHFQASLVRAVEKNASLQILPNGIDVGTFDAVQAPTQNTFLIVSRLIKRKAYHVFLEAIKNIDTPLKVHIVGDGPCLNELKRIAGENGNHEIIFHGWLKNKSEDWKKLFYMSRYFVFPSVQENFPVNLLEAQLSGTLVLASDIAANREVLGDGAIYFKVNDEGEMLRAIKESLEMPDCRYDEIVAKAKSRVVHNFSWRVIGDRYMSIFERAYEEKR